MNYRDVEIIESSIKNGRIYFSTRDMKFFPSDSFGDRENISHRGNTIKFSGSGICIETDVRIYSSLRLSPRSVFTKYFKAAGAVRGALLRVTRTSHRAYELDYLG